MCIRDRRYSVFKGLGFGKIFITVGVLGAQSAFETMFFLYRVFVFSCVFVDVVVVVVVVSRCGFPCKPCSHIFQQTLVAL